MRHIVGITGIRSEYDIMSTVFRRICEHPQLKLDLVVTGAHLSPKYGDTVSQVRDDGFNIIDEIENLINGDGESARVKGLGYLLVGLVQTVKRVKPDCLIVLGDREEAMATALVGAYMNIPVAHVGGGDRVVGNVDDQVRHAVTKLAHLHFATNIESYDRILKLGEQPFRVFNVGNPGLDRLITEPLLSVQQLSEKIEFDISEGERFILLIQHPLSTEVQCARAQMESTLEAVRLIGVKTVIIYPNSDPGSQQMIKAIEECRNHPLICIAKNMPRLEFVNVLRYAGCMLGNSSAGILEAPLLKLPVINVGNRQKGRMHADNVQFVEQDTDCICRALRIALFDEEYRNRVASCINPYGDGHASEKIVDVLANIDLGKNLIIKDVTY